MLPTPIDTTTPAVTLAADDEVAVHGFALAEKALATRRAYRSDFAVFRAWCEGRGFLPLPAAPIAVAGFLADQAASGVRPSTLSRRVAAIAYAHELAGAPSPTGDKLVRVVLGGIRREKGAKPVQKAPVTAERLVRMLEGIPDTLRGRRDRALLALGFAGAFRRSELVALDVADLAFEPDGMQVHIRRSKTDQDGQGYEIAIPRGTQLLPVQAVQAWMQAASIQRGRCFARSIVMGGSVVG